jgi:glycosyltransferase involved in cell wall biosynthesis
VRYLRTGVDTETFYPLEPIQTIKPLRIGWCGKPSIGKRFSPKGYHEVLAPIIRRTNPSVEFMVNTRTSQDALSTAGMVEWYNSIDVLLIVSSCEGTPSIALEAMACGRPLIATEVGILPEVIDEAEQLGSGVCVEILGQYWSQDGAETIIREAEDAIADAVNDRDRLVSQGHAARQVMCESFSWRQLSELWVNTLLEQ